MGVRSLNESPKAKRRHRRTGKPRGAPVGNTLALKHGCGAAWAVAQRKRVNAILREARELLAKATQ